MYFEYFFFKPLSNNEFLHLLEVTQNSKSSDMMSLYYYKWLSSFCRKSQFFYQYQYRKHSDITWMDFCDRFKIPDYEHPDNLGFDLEWTQWKHSHMLNAHYDEYQETLQEISAFQKLSEERIASFNFEIDEDILPNKDIDKLWFNKTIKNSTKIIEELRMLSYERYLQSSHWKRVRSAIMLWSKATCRANECNIIGETWYGGAESELDVHHLTYSNMGNERYDDLALLCKRHHELVHNNLQNMGIPGIELI